MVAIIDVLFFHSLGRAPFEWLFFFTPLRSFTFDILIALWLNWNLKARVNHSKINILCVYARPFGSDRRRTFVLGIVSDFDTSFSDYFHTMHAVRSIAFHLILVHFAQAFFMAHKLFSIALMTMLAHSFASSIDSYIFSDGEIVTFCPSSSFIARPGILFASLNSENFNFISLIKPWAGTKRRFTFSLHSLLKNHIFAQSHMRQGKVFRAGALTRAAKMNELWMFYLYDFFETWK